MKCEVREAMMDRVMVFRPEAPAQAEDFLRNGARMDLLTRVQRKAQQ